MTREERDKAIRILQWLHDNKFLFRSTEEDVKYATKLAIQVLLQEPSDDAVSREAVENITWEEPSYTDALNVLTEVRDKVRELSSVNPQEPSITWVTGADGAKIAFKDVPVWKVTKICEILGEPLESEDQV